MSKNHRYLHMRLGNYDEVCWRKGCITKALLTEGVELYGYGVGTVRPCMFCGKLDTPEEEVYEQTTNRG